MAEYAPKGVSYAGMVTGIVGAAGAVGNAVAEMMQARNRNQSRDPGDRPVTRYELDLIRENIAKDVQLAAKDGVHYTDTRIGEVKEFQAQQLAHNAAQDVLTKTLQGQVAGLYGLTKLAIPGFNIMPPFPVLKRLPPYLPVPPRPPRTRATDRNSAAAG